jgi:hypothetical protein
VTAESTPPSQARSISIGTGTDPQFAADTGFKYVAEQPVICGECAWPNWIVLGSDPGETRGYKCTSWL